VTPPTIDRNRCLQDGICARVCPTTFLRMGPEGFPEPANDARLACYECGACASVCPRGAISAGGVVADELEPLRTGWRLDPERVGQLLRGRRSTRAFREEPLPREMLAELIATAQHSPSGFNRQPIAWTVIDGADRVRRISEVTAEWMRRVTAAGAPLATMLGFAGLLEAWSAGRDVVCRGAPHLLVAHAAAGDPGGAVEAAVAVTTLGIAAPAHGAGTCWAGLIHLAAHALPELVEALGVPQGRTCCAALAIGRPAVEHLRIPRRRAPSIAWR
jgi:nitroreductase/NAD-dependent dihydropyrimidine dehydrogenase PreA subunit